MLRPAASPRRRGGARARWWVNRKFDCTGSQWRGEETEMGEPAVDGIRFFDHAVLPVMDLWRAERFYTEVLDGAIFQKVGMNYRPPRPTGNGAADLFVDPPGAFVKMGRSHIGLFLQTQVPVQPPADLERGFPCLGLAIAEGVFGDVVQRVRAAGVAVGQEGMRTLGGSQWRAVRCADSEGNCLDLVATAAAAGSHQVLGLSYLGAETCDLAATGAFYVDVLGLEIAAEGPGWLAVTVPSGQAMVFHEVPTLSPSMVGPYFGRHFAFYVDDD